MMHDIAQRITWTIRLLMGGTPIILYGDELGLKQVFSIDQNSILCVQNESFLEN
jgi:glycosidase